MRPKEQHSRRQGNPSKHGQRVQLHGSSHTAIKHVTRHSTNRPWNISSGSNFHNTPLRHLTVARAVSTATMGRVLVMRSGAQRESREAKHLDGSRRFTTAAGFNSALRLILNAVPVPLWVANSGSECTFVNRRWTEFTGRPLETELGWGWVGGIHTADRKRVLATIATAIGKGSEFECEYRLRRHDGEYRHIVSRGMPPVLNSQNSGYVGFAWDVTRKLARSAEDASVPGRAAVESPGRLTPRTITDVARRVRGYRKDIQGSPELYRATAASQHTSGKRRGKRKAAHFSRTPR